MLVSTPFTGGCACGAIRYACSAEPMMSLNCHCRDCQRATGSAYNTVVGVPAAKVQFTQGSPQYYETSGERGTSVRHGFCPTCGSPLVALPSAYPAMMSLHASSLDDPSWVRPAVDIWTSRAQPWDAMNPAIPKFETQPTEEEFQAILAPRS